MAQLIPNRAEDLHAAARVDGNSAMLNGVIDATDRGDYLSASVIANQMQ